jgi:hypothetical protein
MARDDRHLDKAVQRIRAALYALRGRSDDASLDATAELLAALDDIAHYKSGRRLSGPRMNPTWLKSNPPADAEIMFGQQVLAVEYIHSDDGRAYRHEFGKGVRLFANHDGTLALEHVP